MSKAREEAEKWLSGEGNSYDSVGIMQNLLDELDQHQKVVEYVQHKPGCRVYIKDPCKCGLDEALAQIN